MKNLKLFTIACFSILLANCKSTDKATEIKNSKPTVYTVGDSTVKNGKGNGYNGLWGWGDFIGQFLNKSKVNIENHALGGTSSRTYQALGLWDKVNNKLQKGDYVLIQFGHNDNGPLNDNKRARGTIKGIGDESEKIVNMITGKHETVYSYGWYITKIVRDAQDKGAIPIIMSPIPRNDWKGGKIPRNNESYGLWAKQVAEKTGAQFIELNDKMASQLEQLGEKNVTGSYFYERDHTHTSAKGAALAASIIVDELKKTDNSIKNYFLENPVVELPAKKNIYLIGDSTMAPSSNPNTIGWGVAFPSLLDSTRVNVYNRARGGRSTRTFEYEGLWQAAMQQFKPGDFVFIQFGHNDAGNIDKKKYRGSLKGMGDESQEVNRDSLVEVVHTYGWYMKHMIRDVKSKGGIPIVLSLTPRNEWPNGKVERRNDSYVTWAEQAAKAEDAYYIDLHNLVAKGYETLGQEKVKEFFPQDHTHTNIDGATFVATTLANYLKNNKEIGLRFYVNSFYER